MELDEEETQFLETQIPQLAQSAVFQAFWRTLAAGYPVLISEDNSLIEVHPDGSRKVIRMLTPGIPVKEGQRLTIR
jgi:hypothetical protein